MRGTSLKQLSCPVFVLLVFVSFLSPYTAEAREHKHKPKHDKDCYHHPVRPSPVTPTPTPTPTPAPALTPPHGECGARCSDSNDCDWPCTLCCWQNQTCCFEEPFFEVPPPTPIPIQAPTPAPTLMPNPPHGECGASCRDSNDCDWPCTSCCWQNQTCCFEEPFFEVPPPASIPILAPTPAPMPMPTIPHGECGASCSDSNDCDWPCTLCCWKNQTCCHEEVFLDLPPQAPPVPIQALTPAPTPAHEDFPPYIHGECGSPCFDSNDCDWTCSRCCGNRTCCYEETYDISIPPYPSPSPSSPLPISQQPPSPSPSPSLDNELAPEPSYDDEVAPQPSYDEYVPYPERACGYQACRDSNDCSWPCTECCSDYSCCYKPQNWAPEPMFG